MTNNIETSYGERKCVIRKEIYLNLIKSQPHYRSTISLSNQGRKGLGRTTDLKNKGKGTNQTSEVKIEGRKIVLKEKEKKGDGKQMAAAGGEIISERNQIGHFSHACLACQEEREYCEKKRSFVFGFSSQNGEEAGSFRSFPKRK